MKSVAIERIKDLSAESFARDYVRRGKPVIVSNDAALDAAARIWNLDYLVSKHPRHRVSIEHYATGDRRQGWVDVEMELEAYVGLIRSGETQRIAYYLAEKPLAEVFPNTLRDLQPPLILRGRPLESTVAFAGIDTNSNAHYHVTPSEAVLTQLCGRKSLTLHAPRQVAHFRAYPWYSDRHNWRQIPQPDGLPPRASAATSHVCTLDPGELLFIPQGWLHSAQGLGESISVTYFFAGRWADATFRMAVRDLAASIAQRLSRSRAT